MATKSSGGRSDGLEGSLIDSLHASSSFSVTPPPDIQVFSALKSVSTSINLEVFLYLDS